MLCWKDLTFEIYSYYNRDDINGGRKNYMSTVSKYDMWHLIYSQSSKIYTLEDTFVYSGAWDCRPQSQPTFQIRCL